MFKKITFFCCSLWLFYTPVFSQIDSLTNALVYSEQLIESNVGISVYDLTQDEPFYSYNGSKKFIPASNLKIYTTYLGLKYLPEQLEVFQYYEAGDTLFILPSADPTLMYKDFDSESVLNFLKDPKYKTIVIDTRQWKEEKFSEGWIWDDYSYDFMPEKTLMPIFGNTLRFSLDNKLQLSCLPFFGLSFIQIHHQNKIFPILTTKKISINRELETNNFIIKPTLKNFVPTSIPLITKNTLWARFALEKLLKKRVLILDTFSTTNLIKNLPEITRPTLRISKNTKITSDKKSIVKSPPILEPFDGYLRVVKFEPLPTTLTPFFNNQRDKVLKVMMEQSDNFIAEHLLMMISKQKLGYIQTKSLFEKLGNEDFMDITKLSILKDGSGLSIYNWLTPTQLVMLLIKIYKEFEWSSVSTIFAGANEGTLKDYFKKYDGQIFAKTGSMNSTFNLSGFFIGKNNKHVYAFSVLTNGNSNTISVIKTKVVDYISKLIEAN